MASTNTTVNYALGQFVGTDKPSWLTDYNGDMIKIDLAIKVIEDQSSMALAGVGALETRTTEIENELTSKANSDSPVIEGLMDLQGGQIKFPSTPIPSADPNVLDDYEEGDFLPTLIGLTFNGTGQTYSTQVGKYIKIGRCVHVWGNVTLTNKGTGTGGIGIAGLPFSINTPIRFKAFLTTLFNVTGKTLNDAQGTTIQGTVNPPVISIADGNLLPMDYSLITNSASMAFYATYLVD